MALRINTNVAALNAHKNMIKNDNALSTSLEKLSSGLRINKAADDASGMAIADSLKSQALGLGQAIRNANDGISMVQTADGALQESINIVNTIKTKAIQAAQDGQTTESRTAIQADIGKLMEELDIIARTTSFNNQKLLSGNFTNKQFQVGAYSGETVNISIASAESTKMGHVATSQLSLANDAAGMVEISIYSNLQNQNFLIEGIDVQYNNSRENSMAAVADAINKFSDVLGVSADAVVESTTTLSIAAGATDSDFKINGVTIGALNVAANDSDGALAKAINQKSAQHGVIASVDSAGFLTMTSSDGRAISVTHGSATGEGTDAVFRSTEMSTLGYAQINQQGSAEIIVNDIGGGNVVALTSDLDTSGDTVNTVASTAAAGSTLAANSVLNAGWTADQTIAGDTFVSNITTTASSTLASGSVLAASSVLGTGTVLGAGTTLGGDAKVDEVSSTSVASTILTDSTLEAGTVLNIAPTELITADMTLAGSETYTATGTAASGSTLGVGTVLAAGQAIDTAGTGTSGVAMAIGATGVASQSSTITSGSVLADGTMLGSGQSFGAAGTGMSGVAITIAQTGVAAGATTFTSGGVLGVGTVLASGQTFGAANTGTDAVVLTIAQTGVAAGATTFTSGG
ncbi:MAG: flagellar protein FlaB, partial [Desulfobulbaceae bacterium]|nr:flagellar protein FlaB [Desulfobulbaceae bacterium]